MSTWQRQLYALTRNRTALVLASAAILVLFGLLGLAQNPARFRMVPENATPDVRVAQCASVLLQLQTEDSRQASAIAEKLIRVFDLPEESLMHYFWQSLLAGKPTRDLEFLAGVTHPPPFANYLIARFYAGAQNWEQGFYFARREFEGNPSGEAKRLVVQLACRLGDRDWLRREEKKADFRKDLTATDLKAVAQATHDWKNIVWFMPQALFERLSPSMMVTVLVSSAVWMIIFLQGARVRRTSLVTALLLFLAFFLGCLSVVAMDLFNYLLLDLNHLPANGEIGYTIAFNVLCVGLPEEAIKLLFFALLLPWLVRRNSESEVLFAAAAVGLGFATMENFKYGQTSGPEIILTRFLLSTTVHFSATGIAGLALARAAANPQRYFGAFLSTFLFVFVLHGACDALLELPELIPGFPLETVVVIFLALQFFRLVRAVREEGADIFSLTATFLLGNSVIIGAVFLATVSGWTWMVALKAISYTVVANLMLMFIFAKQLDET